MKKPTSPHHAARAIMTLSRSEADRAAQQATAPVRSPKKAPTVR